MNHEEVNQMSSKVARLPVATVAPKAIQVPKIQVGRKVAVWRLDDGRTFDDVNQMRETQLSDALVDLITTNGLTDPVEIAQVIARYTPKLVEAVSKAERD